MFEIRKCENCGAVVNRQSTGMICPACHAILTFEGKDSDVARTIQMGVVRYDKRVELMIPKYEFIHGPFRGKDNPRIGQIEFFLKTNHVNFSRGGGNPVIFSIPTSGMDIINWTDARDHGIRWYDNCGRELMIAAKNLGDGFICSSDLQEIDAWFRLGKGPIVSKIPITVTVARRTVTNYQWIEEKECFRIRPADFGNNLVLRNDLIVLREENGEAVIGTRKTVVRATRTEETLVSENNIYEGTVSLNDIRSLYFTSVSISLNGDPNASCRCLTFGDKVVVLIEIKTVVADFNKWAAEMRTKAHDAYIVAKGIDLERVNAYSRSLSALKGASGWLELRSKAKTAKMPEWLNSSKKAIIDWLVAHYPNALPQEEIWVVNWLRENAPEVTAANLR